MTKRTVIFLFCLIWFEQLIGLPLLSFFWLHRSAESLSVRQQLWWWFGWSLVISLFFSWPFTWGWIVTLVVLGILQQSLFQDERIKVVLMTLVVGIFTLGLHQGVTSPQQLFIQGLYSGVIIVAMVLHSVLASVLLIRRSLRQSVQSFSGEDRLTFRSWKG